MAKGVSRKRKCAPKSVQENTKKCKTQVTSENLEEGKSLAEKLPKWRRWALYDMVTLDDREHYFEISVKPITKAAEDDMELVSDVVTWEGLREEWRDGSFECARCPGHVIYESTDKWKGPCVWPSFRKTAKQPNVTHVCVESYNNYTCKVEELYCSKCNLFIGHAFEDGVAKGDKHPEARWRH